jgi:outer membrane immunogenic protein
MKKFLLGAASLLLLGSAPVMAADMAVKAQPAPLAAVNPAYDWSGFYIGGHVGYLWGKTRVVDDGILTEPGAPTNGVVGGVLAGYNWQTGPLVLGIEGDIGWTHATGHGTPAVITVVTTTPNTYDLRWTSHVVGKAGYAAGQWLFFVTGGLSIADLNFTEGVTTTTTIPLPTGGKYFGFSVGGGVEFAFTRNLLGRLQYIYDDFGGKTYVAADGGIYRVSFRSQTARAALSWKF